MEREKKITMGFLEATDKGGTELISIGNRKEAQSSPMHSEILDRKQRRDGNATIMFQCMAKSEVKRNP